MAKKTKQEAQQERLSLAEKRNRQERRNKKSRKEREQEKRRKKQERDRRKQKNIPTTAQQSIPYIRMLQDGICQVTKTFFSKTIQFYDINYQLALNEDKTTIFENYCDFLNYFDSSISVQLSFINQQVDVAEFEKSIDIPDQNDDFNAIREEYRTMLKNQLSKGNNGLVKTKYITFGIEAESLKVARPRLERIETDILNNFKILGAQAHSLNGLERLEILYHVFNQDRIEPFKFQYKMLPETGLKTKDFIAPTSFNFSKNQTFLMGRTMGSVSYLQILAPELTDRMLADFLDVDDSINVNIHIQSIDQSSAIKMIKSKISDLDKMKIEEQKRAVRSGYDMDVLPSDLVTYGEEAKNLLEDLQSRNERMFLVTVLVMNTAKKRQKLDNNIFQVQGIAQKYNCSLKQLDYQQEAALMSCIPLGVNRIEIQRGLTTSSTAIFVPFTTQELFQEGEALYYGLNALSNNMIMVDRKRLKNPNGLILGTPGSGKSFSAKREITNCFLITEDDIIICDPEAEYQITEEDTAFGISNFHFDLSVYDVFGILGAGGKLVLPDPECGKDPAHWIQWMNQENITVWNSVPTFVEMLAEYEEYQRQVTSQSLRLIMMSGDWVPVSLPGRIRNLFQNVEIVALGGATEGSIWSNHFEIPEVVPEDWKSIPYGKPLANQKYYILDQNMEDCPDWVPGTLYIAGDGVAQGYLNDKEKTEEKFVVLDRNGERLYCTGDMGRYWNDGNIEFLGRLDNQVKINGYRVELGEIEAAVSDIFPENRSVVIPIKRNNGIVIIGIVEGKLYYDEKIIKKKLESTIPKYEIPKRIFNINEFPLTDNGKINRKKLAEEYQYEEENNKEKTEITTPLERGLLDEYENILGIRVSVDKEFFSIGGDSLNALKLIRKINEKYNIVITIKDLYENASVRKLAKRIIEKTEDYNEGIL